MLSCADAPQSIGREEIQQSGDHEFLNWLVPLGVLGDRPARIIDSLDEQSLISFKVFAIWD